MIGRRGAADAGAGEIEREAIEAALCFVERLIDTGELFLGHGIGAHARLDLREPFVIGFLEGGEGAVEVADDFLAG